MAVVALHTGRDGDILHSSTGVVFSEKDLQEAVLREVSTCASISAALAISPVGPRGVQRQTFAMRVQWSAHNAGSMPNDGGVW